MVSLGIHLLLSSQVCCAMDVTWKQNMQALGYTETQQIPI